MASRVLTGRVALFVAGLLLLSVVAEAQLPPSPPSGPVVTPGADPSAVLKAAVQFRNFPSTGDAHEIAFGTAPSRTTSQTVGDFDWGQGKSGGINYLQADGILGVSLETTPDAGLPIPVFEGSTSVGNLGPINYVEVAIFKGAADSQVVLGLSGFSPQPPVPGDSSISCTDCFIFAPLPGAAGLSKWKITNIDLTAAFSLATTVGHFVGVSDADYVEISFGFVAPPDTGAPVITNLAVIPAPVLLNGNATVNATVDDTQSGSSAIASALYELNGRPTDPSIFWIPSGPPMAAADGAFDEPVEAATATFAATRLGFNEVCVAASDANGNAANPVCQTFLVTYKFTGFEGPIDNGLLNTASAGQTIPVRWQITDANGSPIANPGSFLGVVSYQIDCASLGGTPTDTIQEDFPIANGLHYSNDGRWQFAWKTPKSYANTCRAMYVQFDSGATSPVVKFSFK